MPKEKFEFPGRGFYLVSGKVAEADFYIQKMKSCDSFEREFSYYLSAFISAARSVTFTLQYVMSEYPNFSDWYPERQARLKADKLARFFVTLRNESQKRGVLWVQTSGISSEEGWETFRQFSFGPTSEVTEVPSGDVVEICTAYFKSVLEIVGECYREFDVYVDPRLLFTERGLKALGWSIEDLEECLGFPRGWTDIPWEGEDKNEQRLKLLSRHGFDEELDEFLIKYEIIAKGET